MMRLWVCFLMMCGTAFAQPYPTKPVRIMVGASAGGGTDIIARMLADKFADSLKQPFIVENRPGASNTIAADITAKASPDGHTLLVATNTAQAIAPHLIKLSYDPLKDVQPIGLIVVVPNVLVLAPNVPARSVQELLALMRSAPAPLRYATAGTGSTQHIAAEAFAVATASVSDSVTTALPLAVAATDIPGRTAVTSILTGGGIPVPPTMRITSGIEKLPTR